jgi:hypothetical protein
VLRSVEAFERARRERAILLQRARGGAEIEAGQGFDLDDVLAGADAPLRDDPA